MLIQMDIKANSRKDELMERANLVDVVHKMAELDPNKKGGVPLRLWLAVHAPAEPTWPFVPVMPSPRPKAEWTKNDRDGPVNRKEIREYEAEFKKQQLVQWPFAWADEMLAEYEKRRQ